jgi:hypothetical protein
MVSYRTTKMNVNFPAPIRILLAGCLIATCASCDDAPKPAADTPLRPLIYTEHPDRTPRAVAVREQRIMRELVEGAEGGTWGALDDEEHAIDLSTSEALGGAIFDALVDRDAAAWDAVFVPAQDYAAIVHIDVEAARDFVDDAQGASSDVWDLFRPEPSSAAVDGGFRATYELRGLQLGEGRAVDGKLVHEGDQPVAQHWGNVLTLAWRGTDQVFELRIPKILRVRRAGNTTLRVASPITADRRMALMQRAGMHLKPELLRSQEYHLPLQVGNFWRYRRFRGERAEVVDPMAAGLELEPALGSTDAGTPIAADATEAIDEVVSVDRYGTWRLVKMLRSYNDANLTKEESWWLVMPRRIYLCVRACRNNIDDASWLLTYIDSQTPIFVFPLKSDMSWGVGGDTGGKTFRTSAIAEVDTPAGVFDGVIRIEGSGPLGTFDGELDARQARDVVWGEGIVRRVVFDGAEPLTEELIEQRVR